MLEPSDLSISVDDAHGEQVVHLAGELDVAAAGFLVRTLAQTTGSPVVVDLAGLTFLDAAGISALLTARRRIEEQGRRLVVRNPSPWIVRVIQLAGATSAVFAE